MSKTKKASDAVTRLDEERVLKCSSTEAESAREIRKRTGFGEGKVFRILHELDDAGVLRMRKEFRVRLDGVAQGVAVYWVEDD